MPDLFATVTITGPFGPHYINRRTPCSMAYNAAGDATITVMLPDSSIITISAPAASYSTRTFPGILSLSVTGGPVTIEIYTPDMVVDPKYLASTTATITGQVQTDPTLANSTTPIYAQPLQYDANNYPIHTIGNVTSNGTDTLAPSTYFYNGLGASGNVTINLPNAPPTGRKYEIQLLGIIIQNNSKLPALDSTSIQFTTAICAAIGPQFNLQSGYAEKYTTLIDNGNSSYNGQTVNDTIILAWTCLPQSLLPSLVVNGAPNAYTNLVYQANSGPASGNTTVVNQPLVVQAGDFFQVSLTWTGGVNNVTDFLAYLFLWGVDKVL
jgi:hypothetical protein